MIGQKIMNYEKKLNACTESQIITWCVNYWMRKSHIVSAKLLALKSQIA